MSEYIVKIEEPISPLFYERQLTEIIRCKDCWHYDDSSNSCIRRFMNFSVKPDGFCNFGRKF